MPTQIIVAGQLDLRLLGARLRELLPLEDARDFDDLVRALDAVDVRTRQAAPAR